MMKIKLIKQIYGIILQSEMGEGNIIGNVSNNGEVTYRENVKAADEGKMSENDYWVPAGAIDRIYVLVDKKSKNTVAGIGDIEDSASKYTEVTAERVFIKDNGANVEYVMNADSYISLDEVSEKNLQTVYNSFEQYYLDRIGKKQIEDQSASR